MDALMGLCTLIAVGALAVGAVRTLTTAGSWLRAAGGPLLVWAVAGGVMLGCVLAVWGGR